MLRPRAGSPSRRRVRGGRRADRRAPAGRRAAERPACRLGPTRSRSRSIGCPSVVDWLVDRFRARAAATVRPADGRGRARRLRERAAVGRLQLVRRRAPVADRHQHGPALRATTLPRIIAHEAYPGHHLEHAWKEADLVDRDGRLEASILLINTPECLISEGLANLGLRFAVPPADQRRPPGRAVRPGRPAAGGRSGRRPRGGRADRCHRRAAPDADHDVPATPPSSATRTDARTTRSSPTCGTSDDTHPAVAAKRLEFIEHPLWRTYIFVYAEGEALLGRWLDAVPEADRAARFGRLLHEQLTPAAVRSPG